MVPVDDPISDVEYLSGDVTRAGLLSEMAHGVDHIFHLLRISPKEAHKKTRGVSPGLAAAIKLITLAESLSVKSFVYLSGAQVYGTPKETLIDETDRRRPISPLGKEYLSIENYLIEAGAQRDITVVILRSAPVIGWGTPESLFPSLFHSFKNALVGRPLYIIGRGRRLVQYIDVEDLASAMVRVVRAPRAGGLILNVAAEDVITQRELSDFIFESFGSASQLVTLPEAVLPALGVMKRLGVYPIGTDAHYLFYPQTIIDPSRAKELLSLTPKRITESLSETFGYWMGTPQTE